MQGKVAIVIAVLAGCATTRATLEKPVANRCEINGLEECAAITDGVVMYAEGDQRLAYQKLHIAAAANEPDDVIAFAGALKTVTGEPGAARHIVALDEIAEVLTREAKEAAKHIEAKETERVASRRKKATAPAKSSHEKRGEGEDGIATDTPAGDRAATEASGGRAGTDASGARAAVDATKGKAAPLSTASAAPLPISEIEGRTVVPATDEGNRACVMSGIMSPSGEASRGYCVRVARGPLVVTDLHSSSACPAELFALSVVPGDLSTPRWALYGQPSSAINVSGGALVVREKEQFVIGVMSSSDQRMKRDIRCAVTWSGWRPGGTKNGAE